jgi:hypothetical protein
MLLSLLSFAAKFASILLSVHATAIVFKHNLQRKLQIMSAQLSVLLKVEINNLRRTTKNSVGTAFKSGYTFREELRSFA